MTEGPVWLFAPANVARKALGALSGNADVVVLDLEDAVAISEKSAARAALAELAAIPRNGALFVRVNAASTLLCLADMQAAVAAGADGIMLPKTETAAEAAAVCWALTQIDAAHTRPAPTRLVPLIETARGLANLDRIDWDARVRCVAFGSVDYAADLGLSGTIGDEAVADAQYAIVRASRAAGLEGPIDGVTLEVRNTELCARDAGRARALGFSGKLAIHPAQTDPIQAAFRPTAEETAWAAEVLEAFSAAEAAGTAAILVRGRLVDYPVLNQAKQILARS